MHLGFPIGFADRSLKEEVESLKCAPEASNVDTGSLLRHDLFSEAGRSVLTTVCARSRAESSPIMVFWGFSSKR